MSLVTRELMLVTTAAVLALAVPIWLLTPPQSEQVLHVPPATTSFDSPPAIQPLNVALSSPPFAPTREPAGVPDAAAEEAFAADAGAAQPAAAPKLVGIVASRRAGVALLKSASGETVTAERGQGVDGWRVDVVAADFVTVSNGSESQTLRLDYGNRVAADAPDAALGMGGPGD